jgi:CubicO group peptidase (beta-lactamase class C family)
MFANERLNQISRRTFNEGFLALGGMLATGCRHGETRRFSKPNLVRLRSDLERHIDPNFAPGLVGLIAQGSETEIIALGKVAFDREAEMRRETIFRIASMTKPVTATAVMMLIADGKLKLNEPVDRLLPELADRRVLRRIDSDLDDTVPARRPITVEDLLTFRCGLGMILAPPNRYPIQKAISDLDIVGFGPPDPAMPFNGDEWMQKLSSLPLIAQPGEEFLYTAGSNIQGVLIARTSGQTLSGFFKERIFGPLGMKDTAFFVPAAKIDRLATAYVSKGSGVVVSDEPRTGKWSHPPKFEQGDAGLVSTVDDYLAFARMLLADGSYHGSYHGRALLAPASVQAMKKNYLTEQQRAGGKEILGPGRGWGYGMSVVIEATPGQPAPGSFGWIGGYGSSYVSDPVADLTLILMTQHEFSNASADPIHQEFQANAYRSQK